MTLGPLRTVLAAAACIATLSSAGAATLDDPTQVEGAPVIVLAPAFDDGIDTAMAAEIDRVTAAYAPQVASIDPHAVDTSRLPVAGPADTETARGWESLVFVDSVDGDTLEALARADGAIDVRIAGNVLVRAGAATELPAPASLMILPFALAGVAWGSLRPSSKRKT